MATLAIIMVFGGAYLCYVSYEAIHNKSAATPLTKAKTAL
jgi:threonine/homoserine/homoserine lactone efflux protein